MPHRSRGVALTVVTSVALAAFLAFCSEGAAQERGHGPSAAYQDTLAAIRGRRDALLNRYIAVSSDSLKRKILAEASREFAHSVVSSIVPFWYATPWDFNGTTQVPGVGSIACGYFVTTVLRDAGLSVERVRLAQQPAETIILTLLGRDRVAPRAVRRFSNVPIERFVAEVQEWGEGIYVVGLDIHVGFPFHDGTDLLFVHSSYIEPLCVVQERAEGSRILRSSCYRVVGKLSDDAGLIRKWLQREQIRMLAR